MLLKSTHLLEIFHAKGFVWKYSQIDKWLQENNEFTTNNNQSARNRYIQSIRWKSSAKDGVVGENHSLIREANKQKRVDFCQHMLSTSEKFRCNNY